MSGKTPLVTVRPHRAAPVLVCKKCLKRVAEGSKIKRTLKSEVKQKSASLGIKGPRVVLTGCFGICPKRAVVVANGTMLGRGEYLLLADREAVAEAVDLLMQP